MPLFRHYLELAVRSIIVVFPTVEKFFFFVMVATTLLSLYREGAEESVGLVTDYETKRKKGDASDVNFLHVYRGT